MTRRRGNSMHLKMKPLNVITVQNDSRFEQEGECKPEPHAGMEFDSAEEAREFYSLYAFHLGFKIRIGQLQRSKADGSVVSRRFVCSKEGFQLNSRTGCPAFIRVVKQGSGKWVVDHFRKDHNHIFGLSGAVHRSRGPARARTVSKSPARARTVSKSLADAYRSTGALNFREEENHERPCPSGAIHAKRLKRDEWEGLPNIEPYIGLEFNSANEAYRYYYAYAAKSGFRIRIGQLFRSRNSGAIASRRFVCSKEGHQHHSRVGCRAHIRVCTNDSGRWVVDRLVKEHNHDTGLQGVTENKDSLSPKGLREDVSGVLENLGLVDTDVTNQTGGACGSAVRNDWYLAFLEFFQSRQAVDAGFFYAVEVEDGKCMSVFWADSHSRFSCSQFGDTVVFDTSYKKSNHLVPFASFLGVNHHKQPVLLACAFIANESTRSFTWIFQAWLRAMSGCQPISIIADQDKAIREAIAKVFPRTRHRFSAWQIKVKEWENLSLLLSMDNDFKSEYEKCVFQSPAADEFDSAWSALLNKYGLMDNAWLREMYENRESWVPLYLRGTFFASIPLSGSMKSCFGMMLNCQTPLPEFILRYQRCVDQSREEESQDDFDSYNLQPILHTEDPIEEQCRKLYTNIIFKVFQKELLESYAYAGVKIYEDGTLSRFLLSRCGDENVKHMVSFNRSNLDVSCSCLMFEFEGVLCRHILKVFNMLSVREVPSRYILHRWTKNAKYGLLRDIESIGLSRDLKPLMLWSLREAADKYIHSGLTSFEKYKLAFEMMQVGRQNMG